MSGGTFDYAFGHVDTFVERLDHWLQGHDDDGCTNEWREQFLREAQPTTVALMQQLLVDTRILAKQMKAVEWLLSGDTGEDTFQQEMLEAELERLK